MSKKFTKQGVRDLNHLQGKSVGRKLEPMPEVGMQCTHKRRRTDPLSGETYCLDCPNHVIDWQGRSLSFNE